MGAMTTIENLKLLITTLLLNIANNAPNTFPKFDEKVWSSMTKLLIDIRYIRHELDSAHTTDAIKNQQLKSSYQYLVNMEKSISGFEITQNRPNFNRMTKSLEEFLLYSDELTSLLSKPPFKRKPTISIVEDDKQTDLKHVITKYEDLSITSNLESKYGKEILVQDYSLALHKAEEPLKLPEKNMALASVMYATLRKQIKDCSSNHIGFENGRSDVPLTFGVAQVSIPKNHKYGKVESPSIWKFQFREDINNHIVITKSNVQSLHEWNNIGRKRLKEVGKNAALVFIHGFNVSFEDAIKRTAQIGYDIQFQGLITTFDWASEAKVLSYLADEDNAKLAVPQLKEFLLNLKEGLGIDTIHVIAHSMGNQVFLSAIDQLPVTEKPLLNEVIFAAPDVDASIFMSVFETIKRKAKSYTLYGSTEDKPISVSSTLRKGYARAGDGGNNLLVLQDLVSIDASSVGSDVLGLGHSYFADLRVVLADINQLITTSNPPDLRPGLRKFLKKELPYWRFAQ